MLFLGIIVLVFGCGAVGEQAENGNLQAVRLGIADLRATFGDSYGGSSEYLEKLAVIKKRFGNIAEEVSVGGDDELSLAMLGQVQVLRREAFGANPLVSGQPILFVVREQYLGDHHNTATMFQTGEINTESFRGGGSLKTIDFGRGGQVRTLLEVPEGVVRDPEVHFDGKRIIFSMRRNIEDDYHIYEINADGTGLKQLTFGRGITDIDPLYMPDDSIVFSSTREPKYCMCARHIMANLYRMEGDGANIHQIGKNTLHEAHGTLMPDGRILYDRWEYVDRNFGDAQGLWTVNPDGTNHAIYWGNNTPSPGGVIDGRIIPGTGQVLCIFGSCHDRPWGALTIVDRRLGLDGRRPVVRMWPAKGIERIRETGRSEWDAFIKVWPKYEDPYPLSDKYFLCSRSIGEEEKTGICLVDIFGNEVLLHTEGPGCFDPMPIAARKRPMQIPSRRDFENKEGSFYIADVYRGTHMKGVRRGTIKSLRVVESPEKRSYNNRDWDGQGMQVPGMNWHGFENKRILGTAPVEADGSAYFSVPSEKFVYFQLLDANGMMVQSMRSGTMVQPGERTGCVGCHESRQSAPPQHRATELLALQREPSKMEGWYGAARKFNYITEVQPVFDKHCVKCHDYGGKAGKKLNLARDRTPFFNTSYMELWRKKYIKSIGGGPAQIQEAYSWGSHASKLVEVIRRGHNDVKLDKESFDRLVTWIDINGPYYPHYATAYPENVAGRCPLDDKQVRRLAELTGVNIAGLSRHWRKVGPQVSFDRPEVSPCLSKFTDRTEPNYVEAVVIIRAGQEMLAVRPRADMAGFEACALDREREDKYVARQQAEFKNRQAIRNEKKFYSSVSD